MCLFRTDQPFRSICRLNLEGSYSLFWFGLCGSLYFLSTPIEVSTTLQYCPRLLKSIYCQFLYFLYIYYTIFFTFCQYLFFRLKISFFSFVIYIILYFYFICQYLFLTYFLKFSFSTSLIILYHKILTYVKFYFLD